MSAQGQGLAKGPESGGGDDGDGGMLPLLVLPVDGVAASIRRQQQHTTHTSKGDDGSGDNATHVHVDSNQSQGQNQGQGQGQGQALAVLGHLAERTTPSSFAHFTHCDPITNLIMLPPTHLQTHIYTYTQPPAPLPHTPPPQPPSPQHHQPSPPSPGQNSGTASGKNSGTAVTVTHSVHSPVTVSFCGWVV